MISPHAKSMNAQSSHSGFLDYISSPEFLEKHFLKFPFAQAGSAIDLEEMGSWEVVDQILENPGVDLLAVLDGKLAENPTHDPDKLKALYRQGHTLVIRKANEHHPVLENLAHRLSKTFRAPIDVHLYCTPAGHHGFGWHYDAEDVFIVQTSGAKQYSLRKNTVHPWPVKETLPRDMRFHREIMPYWNCRLRAGDWLYIPNGYWHRAITEGESISLAIGVMTTTALDVLDFLRRAVVDSLLWRQRLPCIASESPVTSPEAVANLQQVFRDLGEDCAKILRDPEFLRMFLHEKGLRLPMTNSPSSTSEPPRT